MIINHGVRLPDATDSHNKSRVLLSPTEFRRELVKRLNGIGCGEGFRWPADEVVYVSFNLK